MYQLLTISKKGYTVGTYWNELFALDRFKFAKDNVTPGTTIAIILFGPDGEMGSWVGKR